MCYHRIFLQLSLIFIDWNYSVIFITDIWRLKSLLKLIPLFFYHYIHPDGVQVIDNMGQNHKTLWVRGSGRMESWLEKKGKEPFLPWCLEDIGKVFLCLVSWKVGRGSLHLRALELKHNLGQDAMFSQRSWPVTISHAQDTTSCCEGHVSDTEREREREEIDFNQSY